MQTFKICFFITAAWIFILAGGLTPAWCNSWHGMLLLIPGAFCLAGSIKVAIK